jgi:coatomer subunit alpha
MPGRRRRQDEIDPDEGGRELVADGDADSEPDANQHAFVAEEEDLGAGATPGVCETELWVRNSPFTADHVAAGSFETAMQVRWDWLGTCRLINPNSSYLIASRAL